MRQQWEGIPEMDPVASSLGVGASLGAGLFAGTRLTTSNPAPVALFLSCSRALSLVGEDHRTGAMPQPLCGVLAFVSIVQIETNPFCIPKLLCTLVTLTVACTLCTLVTLTLAVRRGWWLA